MQRITAYLEQTYGVGSIVSSDRILAQVNRLNNGDQRVIIAYLTSSATSTE